MKFREKLKLYLSAGFPSIAIETNEEQLVINEIEAVSKEINFNIEEVLTPADDEPPDRKIGDLKENSIYIFLDFQTLAIENEPSFCRKIKNMIIDSEQIGSKIIFIGESSKILPSIQSLITVMEYSLPDKNELFGIIDNAIETIKEYKKVTIKCNKERVSLALRGLNTDEAKNALYLSFYTKGEFDYKFIQNEKIQQIKKGGILDISPPCGGLDQIGGLENLKEYISYLSITFNNWNEESPKGVLCVGTPGSGKSLFSKVVGESLELPTIKFDFSKVKNSLVGESQKRLRSTLKQVEALSPCVIHIDEIEKALAGVGTDSSGVSTELFGILLTWMEDLTAPVFIVATANWLEFLDSALLRRFDDVFFVDLPHEVERTKIFEIHLEKRNIDPSKFELIPYVLETKGFTGSEIEKVIKQSIWKTKYIQVKDKDSRPFDDILKEVIPTIIKDIHPISKVQADQIKKIREVCKFARPASKPLKRESKVGSRKIKK